MSYNIDSIIFISFLVVNIFLGLFSSRGIKTIKEYAVGNRNFSTATIAATIVATWISGEFFFSNAAEIYRGGFVYLIAAMGDIVCILIVGLFFAPRMGEFLGKVSISDAMGSLYGKKVRVITAISGFIGIGGMIAVQLKIAGLTFEYALGLPSIYGILSAGFIITLYSSLGGIKSVTFTDVIQFFTFSVVIPLIAYILLQSIENTSSIVDVLTKNDLFDYKNVFDFSQPNQLHYLSLLFCFAIPAFNPAIFQRIAMAKNIKQVHNSFMISAVVCFCLLVIISWISILVLSLNPNIEPDDVIKHIIYDYSSVGTRGLILAGIMAMIMSTADSYINSTSVIIVHDFCKPLGIKLVKDELLLARIMSLLIGVFSVIFSLIDSNIIELLILSYSFYMPIVSVPFIMALFGFRSTEKSVILGMIAGISTVLIWDYLLKITFINSVPVGMLANLIILISSHYLFKQSGGWVGIKDKRELIAIRAERKKKFKKIIQNIKEFNILSVCKSNYPNSEGLISILGLFVMVVTFSSVNNLSMQLHNKYGLLIDILYPLTLCSSSALISYPLWLQQWKNTKFIAVIWNLIMFSILICFSFLMVLVSNFAEIQLIVFMMNIIIIISLTRWQWALFNILAGIALTSILYSRYIDLNFMDYDSTSSQFKIIYLVLLTISSLVLFLKPKQQMQELTQQRADHLSEQVHDIDEELKKSVEVKNEFLRNLQHEAHTPIVGITTMGQVLFENYDKLTEEQKRKGLKEIAKNSERLSTLVNNMIDVSKLSSLNYVLNKKQINLSELIYERLDHCKKLYLGDKDLEFICDIENNISVNCDEHYITSALDNLIVNAISYSSDGKIIIEFKKNNDLVKFKISDEGIGIPKKELYSIFGTFIVSSRTKTPAGGRGLGLALCKGVIEAHKGQIWCKSDGKKGSSFAFTLPINS
jgi:Na+/proline symporter/signal transduction histidine kinase